MREMAKRAANVALAARLTRYMKKLGTCSHVGSSGFAKQKVPQLRYPCGGGGEVVESDILGQHLGRGLLPSWLRITNGRRQVGFKVGGWTVDLGGIYRGER